VRSASLEAEGGNAPLIMSLCMSLREKRGEPADRSPVFWARKRDSQLQRLWRYAAGCDFA
jgi:hypothetical protein